MQERGVAGEQRVPPAHARVVGEGTQRGELVGGQHRPRGHGVGWRPGPAGGPLLHVGQRGEAVNPVRAVPFGAVAGEVLPVGADELGERAERRGRWGLASDQGGVPSGGAAGEHGRAVAVEDEVVAQLGVPHLLVGQPDDHVRVQRPVHHPPARLRRGETFAHDQGVRRGDRVRLTTDVEHLRGVHRVVGDHLARTVRSLEKAQPQRLRVADRARHRLGEPVDVDGLRTANLHDVPDDVVRGLRFQALGVPDAELGAGQFEAAVGRRPRTHAGLLSDRAHFLSLDRRDRRSFADAGVCSTRGRPSGCRTPDRAR